VIVCDGHDVAALYGALMEAKEVKGQPTVIIAETVKGKGVSFMENNVYWHGNVPSAEEFKKAYEELTAQLQELEG
jgi:transketolase